MVLDVSILGVIRCEGDELKKLVKLIWRVLGPGFSLFVPFPTTKAHNLVISTLHYWQLWA